MGCQDGKRAGRGRTLKVSFILAPLGGIAERKLNGRGDRGGTRLEMGCRRGMEVGKDANADGQESKVQRSQEGRKEVTMMAGA